MAEYQVVIAACLCGRNAFNTSVARERLPLKATICHCYGCRHVTGTLGVAFCDWPSSTKPDLSELTRYDYSPRVWIWFCPTCGTTMFWNKRLTPDSPPTETERFTVYIGVLDKPDETVEIISHICVKATRDGGWADFLPVFNNKPLPRWKALWVDHPQNLDDLLPIGWKLEGSEARPRNESALKAHCLCRGVEFYITRPSTVKTAGVKEGDEWWRAMGDRFAAGCCLCSFCRLASGSGVMHWAFVPKANIKLLDGSDFVQPDFGTLKSYRSSNEASRTFCSRCGCVVIYSADIRHGLVDVAVGMLSAPGGARAEDFLAWRSWKISWEEQALSKRLASDLKAGLKRWGDNQLDGSFQNLSKEVSVPAFRKLLDATNCID